MNRIALLAAAVGVGAVMGMFFKPGNPWAPSTAVPAAPPARVSAAAQAPAAMPEAHVQPLREAPPRVALHGVIYRGRDGARSQVLLSVEGAPEQAYGIGDPVARGWSVHTIHVQRVVLAKGAERAAVEVVAPSSSAAAPAAAAPQPAASVAARPLPGFAAGPRPAAISDASAQERNRRFLDAVQGRAAAQ